MPLGIVSDSDFDLEVEKAEAEIIVPAERGRGNVEGVPDTVRKIIGDEAQENGRQGALELSKFFGTSASSASAYANGATSTASYNKDSPFKAYIAAKRQKISKKAARGISRALEHITEEKLGAASAGELASVARSLSGIVKDMEPPTVAGGNVGVQFIIHAPQRVSEDKFDVIDVTE